MFSVLYGKVINIHEKLDCLLTLWSLTYHVRLGAGDAGGVTHSAIKGPPCSRPALSTVTVGTPSGTTVTISYYITQYLSMCIIL